MIAQITAAAMLMTAPYFGTTEHGGVYGRGSVFEANGKQITTLYSFCEHGGGCADGENPVGGLAILPDGSIVGTTANGGNGAGTAFRLELTPAGWQFHELGSFCWYFFDCARFGTPRGTLQYVGPDKNGFVLEGVAESKKGRGVLYRVTVFDSGDEVVPVRYWGK